MSFYWDKACEFISHTTSTTTKWRLAIEISLYQYAYFHYADYLWISTDNYEEMDRQTDEQTDKHFLNYLFYLLFMHGPHMVKCYQSVNTKRNII